MYQKYHTEALVLATRESGESDKTIALYTQEFGLVWARASAVRSEKSKMRYALQLFTRANVSLVKGRRGWRAAGATALQSARVERSRLGTFARIAELTLRLIRGEETNPYLFAALAEAHEALMHSEAPREVIEIVCVARVLFALGYLSAEALGTSLLSHTAYAMEHIEEAEEMREKLLVSINKAIAETQL
jgi:DNA repair protein RecO (recombination protein O)